MHAGDYAVIGVLLAVITGLMKLIDVLISRRVAGRINNPGHGAILGELKLISGDMKVICKELKELKEIAVAIREDQLRGGKGP